VAPLSQVHELSKKIGKQPMALTSLEGNTKRTVKEARAVWNDPDFQLSDKPQLSELQITKTVGLGVIKAGGANVTYKNLVLLSKDFGPEDALHVMLRFAYKNGKFPKLAYKTLLADGGTGMQSLLQNLLRQSRESQKLFTEVASQVRSTDAGGPSPRPLCPLFSSLLPRRVARSSTLPRSGPP
jgi:hypothetical protein